jgi:outer membrane protein OmpA-like peptidoglycan-associated protein
MNAVLSIGLLAALAGIAGCAASLPPQDLLTARASYGRASRGPAASLDPADLHSASESLQLAEQSFVKDGDTQGTRDLAYIADRRAQIAEARGFSMQSNVRQQATLDRMHAAETSQLAETSGHLGQANMQIALQNQALRNDKQQIDVERQRREEAEQRAARATADLAAFAAVKQETRGMVITLSGSVLFVSNESTLLPSAMLKLNQVADALTRQDSESKILVEGYCDSQGGATYNMDLSQRRAQAVRDYLVARGIASDRLTAQGFGLTQPVADNATAEGRADNRRVEIVVSPAPSTP